MQLSDRAPAAADLISIADDEHSVSVDACGRLVSLRSLTLGVELIQERRLADSFRLSLPIEGRLDHLVAGSEQQVSVARTSETSIAIRVEEVQTAEGRFEVAATFTIDLRDGAVCFAYEVDNATAYPLAEIWYPILGGVTGVPDRATTSWQAPGYSGLLGGGVGKAPEPRLGSEHPMTELVYPFGEMLVPAEGIVMPFFTLHDATSDLGATFCELNRLQRRISFTVTVIPGLHLSDAADDWPSAEELGGAPAGLEIAKVAFPHTRSGRFTSGSFTVRLHQGDWHVAAKTYRRWFESEFPIRTEPSWLRRQDAWFSTILLQPEDRLVATLDEYADWAEGAIAAGVTTVELLGWDKGGIERDYPEYVPDARLGGWDAYRRVTDRVAAAGGNLLTFVNYQVLDTGSDAYARDLHRFRRMDSFGQTENWMSWGESTLKASSGADTRRHVPASPAVPGFRELVDGYLVELVRAGSAGLQIDKLTVSGQLDFNPAHTRDPDVAMCEDLVQAIAALLEECRAIRPEVAFAGEAGSDRFVPLLDVFYRCATHLDISPLRYAFPEWTSCVHTGLALDRCGVNAAVMLGAVLVIEPLTYQAPLHDPRYAPALAYITAVLALRRRFLDRIFLADYLDRGNVRLSASGDELDFRVHARTSDGARSIVVVNRAREPRSYELAGLGDDQLWIHTPFAEPVPFAGGAAIEAEGLHVLVSES